MGKEGSQEAQKLEMIAFLISLNILRENIFIHNKYFSDYLEPQTLFSLSFHCSIGSKIINIINTFYIRRQ